MRLGIRLAGGFGGILMLELGSEGGIGGGMDEILRSTMAGRDAYEDFLTAGIFRGVFKVHAH